MQHERVPVALLTFGGGAPSWRAAARRLGCEAEASGWFSHVVVHDERSLAHISPSAAERAQSRRHSRGFGYWMWKPLLVGAALETLPEGSLLVYADAGCHLNVSPASAIRFSEYCAFAGDTGGVAMRLRDLPEWRWSKMALLNHLNVPEHDRLTSQVCATTFVLRNDRLNRDLVTRWLGTVLLDDGALVDDELSRDEVDGFREHRHDQSVWSCLVKSSDISLLDDETYWAPHWERDGVGYPLWATRHRSGTAPGTGGLVAGGRRLMEAVRDRLSTVSILS